MSDSSGESRNAAGLLNNHRAINTDSLLVHLTTLNSLHIYLSGFPVTASAMTPLPNFGADRGGGQGEQDHPIRTLHSPRVSPATQAVLSSSDQIIFTQLGLRFHNLALVKNSLCLLCYSKTQRTPCHGAGA